MRCDATHRLKTKPVSHKFGYEFGYQKGFIRYRGQNSTGSSANKNMKPPKYKQPNVSFVLTWRRQTNVSPADVWK